jgi:hypothetical protein
VWIPFACSISSYCESRTPRKCTLIFEVVCLAVSTPIWVNNRTTMTGFVTSLPHWHCMKYGEHCYSYVTSFTHCLKYGEYCYVISPYALYEVWRTLPRHFPLRIVWSVANTVTSLPLRTVWSMANIVTSLPPLHSAHHTQSVSVTMPYSLVIKAPFISHVLRNPSIPFTHVSGHMKSQLCETAPVSWTVSYWKASNFIRIWFPVTTALYCRAFHFVGSGVEVPSWNLEAETGYLISVLNATIEIVPHIKTL